MKFKPFLTLLAATCLIASGCGNDIGSLDKAAAPKAPKDPIADVDALKGNEGERARAAAQAFSDNPQDVAACNTVGMAWLSAAVVQTDGKDSAQPTKRQKQYAALAVEMLRKCVKIEGAPASINQSLVMALTNAGDFDGAKDFLKEIAQANPKNADAWHAYGAAAQQAGDKQEAEAAWKKFIALAGKSDPRVKMIKQSLGLIPLPPPPNNNNTNQDSSTRTLLQLEKELTQLRTELDAKKAEVEAKEAEVEAARLGIEPIG